MQIKIKVSKTLQELSDIFLNASNLYIVGGYIRDYFINKKSYDIDLCSSLKLNEVEKLLKNSKFNIEMKNKTLGTAIIYYKKNKFDYSVFRREKYSLKVNGKHNPKEVEFIEHLEEDALRRDFTINAIYYDINKKEIIDPLNAIKDIQLKRIMAIPPASETLKFDGDRILRLAKLVAKLGFSVEDETLKFALIYSKNVLDLSNNHINKFIEKLSKDEKFKIKNFLNYLNLNSIANQIN